MDGSTRLTYMQQRYMDPTVGVFLSLDPVTAYEQPLGQFNRYRYANGSPYAFTDPDGRLAWFVPIIWGVGAYLFSAPANAPAPGEEIQSVPAEDQIAAALPPGKLVGVVKTAINAEKGLRRPYIRKDVRAEVENRAPRAQDGRPIDPNTQKPIDGKPDLGHKPGSEHRTEKAKAESQGMTQAQFNDKMNNPDKFQLEDPSSNRSHRFEAEPE
jgi:RHS repeat-associated protein